MYWIEAMVGPPRFDKFLVHLVLDALIFLVPTETRMVHEEE
jgi:hypothetical protein